MDSEKKCDMCQKAVALYDGKTLLGQWAYMCKRCFKGFGVGLGLGKGQELIYTCEQANEPK